MTKEEAEQRIQVLLAGCRIAMDEVAALAEAHDLDGLTMMNMTYRRYRESRYGDKARRLRTPGWFDREYWNSSTAGCELDTIWEDDEEEP